MILSQLWCGCAIISALCSILCQTGNETGTSLIQGAASAVTVSVSIAGPMALWSGLGNMMENTGVNRFLYKPIKPILARLFPSTQQDPELAGALSANICANLLGLGNAATPMGIRAAKRLQDHNNTDQASDEMCRLVVMNTASIQLIPTTVAAVRASAGCSRPLDILPCVWITSICSVSAGLLAAQIFKRAWRNG